MPCICTVWHPKHIIVQWVHIKTHTHCRLGVTLLLLMQQARVRSLVGSISWLRFFPKFSLNCKTNVRKFGPHSCPVIIYPSYIIRPWPATISDLSYSIGWGRGIWRLSILIFTWNVGENESIVNVIVEVKWCHLSYNGNLDSTTSCFCSGSVFQKWWFCYHNSTSISKGI